MSHQRTILKSVSSFLALAIVFTSTGSIGLILSSPNIALAETREQSVDSVTDWLFGNLHPELNRRKLRSDEYEYIQEWNVIRQVIAQGGLRYHKVDPNSPGCGEPDWTFPNDDEALRERLANAVFYSRHPERNGEPIRQDETAAIQEWLKLKDSMFVAYC